MLPVLLCYTGSSYSRITGDYEALSEGYDLFHQCVDLGVLRLSEGDSGGDEQSGK